MRIRILVLLAFVTLFFSCTKNNTPLDPQAIVASNSLNVPYGTDPLQKMDMYLPAGRTTATIKVVIIIHGGGWNLGDKSDMTSYVEPLQNFLPGYAVFNINYRLAASVSTIFPTQENDVKAAIDFINSKRAEYNISDKFVLLGVSAGAHLSLLQAYKYSTPKIKAVVDFFGPTDMAAMYNDPASIFVPASDIALLFGGATPATNPTIYAQSSPITFVNAQSVPTIILHGGLDALVKVSQATSLRDKLALNNIVHQYVFYPNEAHGWAGANLLDSYLKIQTFLNTNVQ
jgi:acetyl esterase/lipase